MEVTVQGMKRVRLYMEIFRKMESFFRKNLIIKHIVTIGAFLLIVFCIYQSIIPVFENKSEEELSKDYRDFEKDIFDVVFLGSSAMKNAVYPMQLYHEYGIASYNLGCGSQSMASSYYLIKEIIREQKPDLIVLDCIFSKHPTAYLSEEHLHYVTDAMNYPEKLELVFDIVPSGSRMDFLFEMGIYHNRFNALSREDFSYGNNYTYGAKVHYWSKPFDDNYELTTDSEPIPEISEEYLLKTIELCKENDVELLLTVLPLDYTAVSDTMDRNVWQKYFNYIQEIAEEHNINYMNFMYQVGETGIDAQTDYDGGTHLNYWGAVKMTSYLGNYIINTYDIPDVRNNSKYKFMEDDYSKFIEYTKLIKVKQTNNLSAYLDALYELKNYNYTIYVAVKDIQGYSLTEDVTTKLQLLGFDQANILLEKEYHSFIGILNGGKLTYQFVGDGDEPGIYKGMINEQPVVVESKTLKGGNLSSVNIGSVEYAPNLRGLNFVVVDNETRDVVDSVAFDTHVPEFTCRR